MSDRPQTSAQPESPSPELPPGVRATMYMLRELLWLRHGCPISALYGDDGEMQCSQCGIDFKRDPVERIEATWREEGEEALRRARSGDPTEDTQDEELPRQRTTEEVVHETIANFLRQRVEHHELLADMVTEPFAGDHRELARAFEERRQGQERERKRMVPTDLANMVCTVERPGVEFQCIGWLQFEDAHPYVEGHVTLFMWPHQVLQLFEKTEDGWPPPKGGPIGFEVESHVTYRGEWRRFRYEAYLEGAEDLHRGVPARLTARFARTDEVIRWLNSVDPNIARPEDFRG